MRLRNRHCETIQPCLEFLIDFVRMGKNEPVVCVEFPDGNAVVFETFAGEKFLASCCECDSIFFSSAVEEWAPDRRIIVRFEYGCCE